MLPGSHMSPFCFPLLRETYSCHHILLVNTPKICKSAEGWSTAALPWPTGQIEFHPLNMFQTARIQAAHNFYGHLC